MKWSKRVTISILIVVTLILVAWDVYVAVNKEKGDTISEILFWISRHPAVPFAFGVLMGHLFWPQYKEKNK